MIDVNLYEDEHGLVGFLCEGHAGYAEDEEDDIVCSAVTSLAGAFVVTVTDILDLDINYDFQSGRLWCRLVDIPQEHRDKVNLLLQAFEMGCKQAEFSYGSEYVRVKAERVRVR